MELKTKNMQDQIGNEKRDHLHRLLDNTTYDDDKKVTLHYIIDELVNDVQYDYVLNRLKMNEIQDKDRIAFGFNYNQSDIKKRLRNK